MAHPEQVIHIHVAAPAKPAVGADCNGCGVCCLAEPCPLGVVLSRSSSGPCKALRWNGRENRYHCGAAIAPETWVQQKLAWLSPPIRRFFAQVLRRLALRWIAAGSGCDSTLLPSATMEARPTHDPAKPPSP